MAKVSQDIQYYVTDDRMLREKKHVDPDDLVQIHALEQTGPVVFITCEQLFEIAGQEAATPTARESGPVPDGMVTITSMKQIKGISQSASNRYEKFYRLAKKRMTPEQAALVRTMRLGWGFTWRSVARYCWEQNWRMWRSWQPVSNQLMGMAICRRAAEIFGENFREPPWN